MFKFWQKSSTDDWNITNSEKAFDKLNRAISKNEREVILFKKGFNKYKRRYRYILSLSLILVNIYYHYFVRNQMVIVHRYSLRNSMILTASCLVILSLYTVIANIYYNFKIKKCLKKIRSDKLQFNTKIEDLKLRMNYEKIQQILNMYENQIYSIDTKDVNKSDSYDDEVEMERLEEKFDQDEKLKRKRKLIQQGLYKEEDFDDDNDNGFFNPSKILNILLGRDETSANQRYALICVSCFTNNGLAPPRMLPSQVKFKCISCGAMNNVGAQKSEVPNNGITNQNSEKLQT